jgi:hypothetical protein
MESSPLFFSDLVRLIGFSIALAGALIAFALYRRNRPTFNAEPAPVPVATKIAYRDAPTVRVVDSQHFDRLRRTVRLAKGEQIDVLASHPIVGPRFRLTLKSIEMLDATPAAHLEVVYSGIQVSCGPLAKEIGYNEFLVPRAARDESRTGIFHYHESGEALEFMRIKVNAIDVGGGSVEFEVMQMRGSWPGLEG